MKDLEFSKRQSCGLASQERSADVPQAERAGAVRSLQDGRVQLRRRWFAWRPVPLVTGGWAWLATVERQTWGRACGDYYFERSRYALLP